MAIENKFARIMRNTGPARFFIPAGIFMIIFGIIMAGFETDNFIETTGTVTGVEEHVEYVDNKQQTQYDISFTYNANGKEYTGTFDNMGKGANKGDSIKVFYDPENPERITNSKMDFLGPVLIGVGALAIAFGVFKTVRGQEHPL